MGSRKLLMSLLMVILMSFLFGCATDEEAPIIWAMSDVTIELGDESFDLNDYITAEDDIDGQLELNVGYSYTGSVNLNEYGYYPISITAIDQAGNIQTKTMTVFVRDTTAPSFDSIENQSLEAGISNIDWTTFIANLEDPGNTVVTKSEVEDGVDYDTPGTYTVIVSATDDSMNVFARSFTVEIVDTTAPVVESIDPVVIEAGLEDVDWTTYVTGVTDNSDGNISIYESNDGVVYSALGDYTVLVKIEDESGNITDLEIEVTVQDTTIPVITLTGESVMNLEYPESYTELGATCSDNLITDCEVVIAGDVVDSSTLGTYVVTYNVTDSEGNVALEVTRTVIIEDTVAPLILLNGESTVHLEYLDVYNEVGALCYDTYASECEVVIAGDAVDTSVLGTYVITYNVTDNEGNVALEVTRTIIVEDTTAPVIVLNGEASLNLDFKEEYTELGARCSDNYDSECTVVIGGTVVDHNAPGLYIVIYTATDSKGNIAIVERLVEIADAEVYLTVSDIYNNAMLNDYIEFSGIVVDIFNNGYFLNDGTHSICIFAGNNGLAVEIGDEVRVKGLYANYFTLRQISSLELSEVLSSGNLNPLEASTTEISLAEFNQLDLTDLLIHGQYYTLMGTLEYNGVSNNIALFDGEDYITIAHFSNVESIEALEGHIGETVEIQVTYYTDHNQNGILMIYSGGEEGITVLMTSEETMLYDVIGVYESFPEASLEDINLPVEGRFGTIFSDWTSSDTTIYSNDGIFLGSSAIDVTVTFTATATRGILSELLIIDVYVPSMTSVEEVLNGEIGEYFQTSGVIYEVSAYGFFIEENGHYLFVYAKEEEHSFVAGDSITFLMYGEVYNGLRQASTVGEISLNSQGNPDIVPTISGTVEGLEQGLYPRGSRVEVTAVLSTEGVYNTIYLNGVAGGKIAVYYRSNEHFLSPLGNATVRLTVVAYKDQYVLFQEDALDVVSGSFDDAIKAQSIADSIDLGDLSDIRDDLSLPTDFGDPNILVSWTSSDYEAINENGTIYRQDGYDVTVTLTVTITIGLEVATREFDCVVRDVAVIDNLVIGTNIYSFNDNFYSELVIPEMDRYAVERGITIYIVDSDFNQATLNSQVDEFIAEGVDVLVINLVEAGAAGVIIEKAKAADIPLIFFGHSEPTEVDIMTTYDKVWYVGEDVYKGGKEQGEMIVTDWISNPNWDLNADGVLDYVILQGNPEHPYATARTNGVINNISSSGITMNQLASYASSFWSTVEANSAMETWLTSPFANDIEMIICNNDGMAFGVIQALAAAGMDIPVYGIDGFREAFIKIESGEMQGTAYNDGEELARTVLNLAINAALGLDVVRGTEYVIENPTTKAIRIPYVIVTIDNVYDYLD